MGSIADIATQANANYLAATATAGAAGHVAFLVRRSMRRGLRRPLHLVLRTLRHVLGYTVVIGALWLLISFTTSGGRSPGHAVGFDTIGRRNVAVAQRESLCFSSYVSIPHSRAKPCDLSGPG
jgi:hypothetical protein